jgi:cyanophycin synthetase
VVIKPANRERSEGVSIHITDDAGVQKAFAHASTFSKFILVEKQVPGICHRLMIANGRFLYALWRKPMSIMGNGVDDVAGLLSALRAKAEASPPWARDKVVPLDDLTRQVLLHQGMTENTVPSLGQQVLVRFVESTEWGEDRGDATATTHPENVKLAERAARAMGLSNVGVDIISPDIGVPWFENGAMVNEVNYAPHFGGTEVARSHMPAFIRDLIDGDGRIPIVVFLGQSQARRAAESQQAQWRASGLRGWLTSATETRDAQGKLVPMACAGVFARTMAMLSEPDVQALAIVLDDATWVLSGAPVDRIEAWHDLQDSHQDEHARGQLIRLLNGLSPKPH